MSVIEKLIIKIKSNKNLPLEEQIKQIEEQYYIVKYGKDDR